MLLKTLNHTILYFMIRFISGVIGLVSIYILTRLMSVKEYGSFTLFIAILTFTSGISFQWLSISISRLILEYKQNLYSFIKAAVYLFLISSIVASIIIFVAKNLYSNINMYYYFIFLFISIVLGIYNIFIQLSNIVQKPLLYGSLSSTRAIFSLFTSIVLIVYFNLNTIGAIIGFGVGFLISILLFLFVFKSKITNIFFKKETSYISTVKLSSILFRYGMPLTFTYLAVMFINVSDRFMLAKMSSAMELSSYSVAYDLAQQTIGLLMNTLFLAYFPKIIQAYTKGLNVQLLYLMKQLGTAMLIIAVLVNIVYINASEGISNIMFGGGLSQKASVVLPIISIGMAIGFYKNYYLDVSFQVMKRTDMQFKITAIMAIVNIILNLILIPIYGSIGASIATLLAFSTGAVISYVYSKKIIKMPVFINNTIKVISVAVCISIASWYFKFSYADTYDTLSSIVILISLYIILLIILNVMNIQKKLFILLGKGK